MPAPAVTALTPLPSSCASCPAVAAAPAAAASPAAAAAPAASHAHAQAAAPPEEPEMQSCEQYEHAGVSVFVYRDNGEVQVRCCYARRRCFERGMSTQGSLSLLP